MSTPSPMSQELLLFAKYHYGPWNRDSMCALLVVILDEHLLMHLDMLLDADGNPKNKCTRDTMLTAVCRAIEDYSPAEGVHSNIFHSMRLFAQGDFLGGLASLLGHLGNVVMKEDDHQIHLLPQTSASLRRKLDNAIRTREANKQNVLPIGR